MSFEYFSLRSRPNRLTPLRGQAICSVRRKRAKWALQALNSRTIAITVDNHVEDTVNNRFAIIAWNEFILSMFIMATNGTGGGPTGTQHVVMRS